MHRPCIWKRWVCGAAPATRWQQVLLREADDRVAEAVLQRLRYCLGAGGGKRVSDGTAPAGATLVARNSVPNGPDLWRME
ncbi:Uncharacterised protein [Klebsiella pneumoniae]|nr:Uncharacterised protein [Klebsiella pneumoniae]